MELDVLRWSSGLESTLGGLFVRDPNRHFLCYTLEDEFRTVKVFGETRVPAGRYKVTLRTEGGFHDRYLKRYGAEFHKGMLWVRNVPNFQFILIHIGNDDDDTAGCLLVGDKQIQNITNEGIIESSGGAYKRVYPLIRDAILELGFVWINYINYDPPV